MGVLIASTLGGPRTETLQKIKYDIPVIGNWEFRLLYFLEL